MTFRPNATATPVLPVVRSTSFHGMGQVQWQYSGSGAPASTVWPSANLAIAMPVFISDHCTVRLLTANNGTVVSGNIDVGIYRQDFTLAVAMGGAAQSGTSAIQTFNVTDTVLSPGWYYLAASMDNVTGRIAAFTGGSVQISQSLGAAQMAAAYPLPSTFTPAVIGQDYLPDIGLSLITDI